MKKIDIVKRVVGLVVSVGIGAIVTNVVKCTTPGSVGKIIRFCIGVGSFALAGAVSEKAVVYTDKQIDEVISDVKKAVKNEEI
jgi:hypothetical protein